MGLATLPSTLKPPRRYRNVGLGTIYSLVCKVQRTAALLPGNFRIINPSSFATPRRCRRTQVSENCADRNTISRSNLHNGTYTIESTRGNLHDGIYTLASTRWNPHDGIYTTHPHDAIIYNGHKDHDIHKRHGSR